MYELFAVTVLEALTLLLVLAAHGAVIALLVRRGRLAPPRPVSLGPTAPPARRAPATPRRQERLAA
jgi:hypothetical protein